MLQLKIWGPHGPLLGKVGGPMGPHRPQRRAGGLGPFPRTLYEAILRQFFNMFFPGKKSQLCCEKICRFTVEFGGAMGPPTFTQPGSQGPLLYPEGAHGAP